MIPLVEPQDGIWVFSKEEDLDVKTIGIRFETLDAGLFDLDGSDAIHPAKEFVRNYCLHSGIFNPEIDYWLAKTAIRKCLDLKGADSKSWKELVDIFSKDKKIYEKTRDFFSPEVVEQLVYPRVLAFYASLPHEMHKAYVTRNINTIANIFARYLGINEVFSLVFDKEKETEKFVLLNHPKFKRYLVKGDSEEDIPMLSVLRHYKKKGTIESCIGVWVSDSPDKLNPEFDLNISRDHSGLTQIIQARFKII